MPPSPNPTDKPQTVKDFLTSALPEASPRSRQRLIKFGRVTVNGRPAASIEDRIAPGDSVVIEPPKPAPPGSPPSPVSPAPAAGSPSLRPTNVPPPRSSPRPNAPYNNNAPPTRDRRDARFPPRSRDGARPDSRGTPPFAPRSPQGARPPHAPRSPYPSQSPRPNRPGARPSRLPAGVSIIYEDDDLLVVDKPPGIITASPTPVRESTLLDVLKDHLRTSAPRPRGDSGGQRSRFGVIHRLDREASGLLVFTKTDKAFFALKEEFRAKRVHRQYLALVEGHMGEPETMGTIQSFLKETPSGRVVSIPTDEYRGAPYVPGARRTGENRDDNEEGGAPGAAKLAVTHYRVLAAAGNLTLLQVRLETGRKHQIRVHLADRGHPVAGDHRHNAQSDPVRRLALHAAELGFTHPQTGKSLRFTSPAPAGFYRSVGLPPPKVSEPPPSAAPPHPAPAPSPAARPPRGAAPETSWDEVADWYDDLLEGPGEGGGGAGKDAAGSDHYENVILPGALRLLAPQAGQKILDVACGQGILARRLAPLGVSVTGVEASASLVEAAQRRSDNIEPQPRYLVGDARDLAPLNLDRDFDAAACIMALANIDPVDPALRAVAEHLRPGGRFVAVITHPAFRAPGQTTWGWDAQNKKQYRRIDGYLSPGQHRIAMHPGKDPSITTWTFHRPLQTYISALTGAGLLIDALEEWPGHRTSTSGPRAQEENRSRREIPLFLAIRAVKAT